MCLKLHSTRGSNCAYENLVDHAAGEFTSEGVVASDPTLRRTKPVRCAGEAVFFHRGGQLRIHNLETNQ